MRFNSIDQNTEFVKTYTKAQLFKWAESIRTGNGTDRAVLAALVRRADRYGACHPSHATICRDLEISPATLKRSLKRLREARLMTQDFRYTKRGRRASNLYLLNVVTTAQNERKAKNVTTAQFGGDHYVDHGSSKLSSRVDRFDTVDRYYLDNYPHHLVDRLVGGEYACDEVPV